MTTKKTTTPAAGKPVAKGDHVYLIDGSGYIFRAYHALPPLTRPSDGLPVGAVHGFCGMLWKLLRETGELAPPTHMAVVLDYSAKTFRNDLFDGYKANRSETPEDLIPQFPLVRDAVRAFNVSCVEKEGFEADDLIATYAFQALEAGATVTIVSSDKDLMQIVRPGIVMYDTMKNKVIDEEGVAEKFGVPPEKVVDVQALIGDSSDNVPGVPGIGVKTAALLINEYGDLDTLLARAEEIKQQKRRENLITFADQARLSRTLVTLDTHVDLDVSLAETAVHQPDTEALTAFMRQMEFSTLLRRVAEGLGAPLPEGEAKPATARKKKDDYDHPLRRSPRGEAGPARDVEVQGGSPAELAIERASKLEGVPFDRANYETVTEIQRLIDLLETARFQGHFAFRVKLNGSDPMLGEIAGVALALVPGHAAYVPLAHRAGDELDLGGETTVTQIPVREALDALKPVLEDEAVLKIVQNAKADIVALGRYGIALQAIDDPCLMSYALDAGRAEHLPGKLAGSLLGYTCLTEKEVMGTGKAAVAFDRVAVERATEYAGEETDLGLRLWTILKPRLAAESVTTVYETLERPLAPVLAEMERAGVKVDRATLASLSGAFAQTIARLEDEIRELAGEDFNVGSPKQLGEILFDKMSLAGGRRTKTGAWSTDAATLEELAAQGHELPRKVLDWRLVAKLKSTYTDALPTYIHPETGRVHTSYALAATTTGRLSSVEPNLQNIPVRTSEGRSIRKAFVADKGKKLISADYSQIELRVLAHMADTPTLRQAFADGLDIHAMTASEMFGVPIEGMDPNVRRKAKAINFGIIYGISAFGLGNQLGIPRGEAADYINTYFERFPGIRDYMEAMKAEARRTGYVKTLFGRKIHYPEINTKNPSLRGNYERAAITAPIQGSAADIIRRAMIRMAAALAEAGLQARMLLQVHDELIFEAPEDEADKTMEVAQAIMENAAEPALRLQVPLKVDARAADNWEAAH
ncbi:DNA polymerase I [Methyloceanibacter superfactus]|uniref:DNA polymerase I n=1 Tax=Methyloceanibacter superfactus TaxID=1774969 RepID=A0A1E3W7J1_9HYPH|nr:DNA polymerase I [Methyloceanibacter superfactus]ODS01736.1 DNA polymerase I [Methyloceanibacter superfactus]